jgi:hypothetical protein
MSTKAKMSFKQHSMVWVWDSTWLPAIVVRGARMGCVLVRLAHGVTFSVTAANLVPRDPACRGGDIPSAGTCRSFVLQPTRNGLTSKDLWSQV